MVSTLGLPFPPLYLSVLAMMATHFLVRFLNTLKKWLSQLARRSASSLSLFLSLFRQFASRLSHLKLGVCGQRLFAGTRFSSSALPRSLGNIAREDAPICSSFLPPPPSDDPYSRIHSQHSQLVRKGTAMPLSETDTTWNESTAEINGLHQGSMSSLHQSLQTGESSGSNTASPSGDPFVGSSSPGPSRPFGHHELSGSHSRSRIYMNDAYSLVAEKPTPSTTHLAIGMTHSKHSLVSQGSGQSVRSQCGQAALRLHKGPIYYLPDNIHSSIVDLQNEPLDLATGHHVRFTAPPGSDDSENPGSKIVEVHEGKLPEVFPMIAKGVMRYERCIPRAPESTQTTVPAMMTTFLVHNPEAVVPLGWTTLVHPEGSRYFLNEKQRTVTEVDVFDPQIYGRIDGYMRYLWSGLKSVVKQEKRDLDITQVDLVLELKNIEDAPDSSATVCCYYFVNHNSRCLFWLQESDIKDVLSDCKGVESLSHIRLAIQAQYWFAYKHTNGQYRLHWEYFPSLCLVSQDHVDEVKDMLIHATCDHLTSKRSSALGDVIELKDYISVVDGIKIHSPENQQMQRCHAAIVIGRIMKFFSENQFINFHGENCVRLTSDETVHGWEYTPSLLMVVVAPLLFLDPVTQVQELHRVFVDEIVSMARWNALSSKLKGQLQDTNLLATVLLNVNVGFLAINTVDKGRKSAIQMASYMSLVTSMGSIILGIFLVWHERTSGDNTAMEAATFASGLHDKKHGLEKLAIIYSVPKALLMWGMVFFFMAFSINWCGAGDTTSRAVVGATTLIVFVMISNGIIRIREGERWWWRAIGQQLSSLPAHAWKRVVEFVEMKGGQRCEPQHDPDEATLHTSNGLSQANIEAGHEDHSRPSIPRTRSYQSNASVVSKDEGQTAAAAAANDTGTAISPSSYHTEHKENARYTDNIVAEPEEIDYPRPSTSTTPHPKIVARSATNEPFRHAPVAAQWTLKDGQDIEEHKEGLRFDGHDRS